ncbi:non-hydrolyzing UDP-N-acetylglucosamine 2-epimerase [Thermoflexus sp.]|uniref:non-hydrolyzing UDP-N-acetylglucosamine 2-epimerase n=1 Tax=Thermoflexus sp. TaxID=1969742 RepID=UPI0025E9D867|nr:UDP-N-acetylglucosamine 2-epimerase (non-hydrolyzing) [Thermoflexus sp.]MDW8179722.1 UDP-N-acetylglucosamine 2-epimerase (non-hydrolyzing) [Anaerolineae bacterium]MCS6964651.1 UDP-N-acetylglucosamine 2-epimerase (non-hydrolyzing) [Thermoflexus sp.]MCS7350271.1 UDP-N-acetylglucosamine 2-epimerase (non-hydrolyzing) [Thermoflexus sp.]MCX7689598.1 UDP-N-acetylglucosamine 2-epimerase (non-hydrolyzing) [Thermoflexus sp.]MDW8184198.1 UDP-N-acetylglucosamine 2-epimerase (non-hydrolyzing) [Anaerolin
MKIVSVVGARPEFIQAAPVSFALRQEHHEVLVHTGQHYDDAMSRIFFEDLDLPAPDYHLGVGSGPHGRQTGEMMARLEEVLWKERPDLVIVRGDTNSTLAGALAAAKLHIPLVHIEAGERSFNKFMPEEINRLVADRLADLHFCITRRAVQHLAREGITDGVFFVGDVMLDAVRLYLPSALERAPALLERLGLEPGRYLLATVHRAGNTDDPRRLSGILAGFRAIPEPIVFPVHPRTRQAITRYGLPIAPHIQMIEPVGYLDMLALEAHARMILTDSGGVQREAYFLGIPCLTLREETELMETVEVGWNRLVGTDPQRIVEGWRCFRPLGPRPPLFGDGHAAERIAAILGQSPPRFGQHYRRWEALSLPAQESLERISLP